MQIKISNIQCNKAVRRNPASFGGGIVKSAVDTVSFNKTVKRNKIVAILAALAASVLAAGCSASKVPEESETKYIEYTMVSKENNSETTGQKDGLSQLNSIISDSIEDIAPVEKELAEKEEELAKIEEKLNTYKRENPNDKPPGWSEDYEEKCEIENEISELKEELSHKTDVLNFWEEERERYAIENPHKTITPAVCDSNEE